MDILWRLVKEPEFGHIVATNQEARIWEYFGDLSRSQNLVILWQLIKDPEFGHIVATNQGARMWAYCGH